jgi:integrase
MDLDKVTAIFKDDIQITCLLKLGSVSGLRAYELYSLTFDDIDLSNRTISVNRNNGKSTKNLKSIRTVYFNETARQLLTEYFDYCKLNGIKKPFNMLTINHKLKGHGFMIKDLRHIFIRTASLRGMNLPILQRLIGHASGMINSHYLFISDSEIKQEYDRIFQVTK